MNHDHNNNNQKPMLEPYLTQPPDRIAYTLQELAKAYGVKLKWLHDQKVTGRLAFVRLYGRSLILLDDLEQLRDPRHPRDGTDTLRDAFTGRSDLRVVDLPYALGISRSGAYRLVARGDLPTYSSLSPGRRLRIKVEDLKQFLLSRRVPARRMEWVLRREPSTSRATCPTL